MAPQAATVASSTATASAVTVRPILVGIVWSFVRRASANRSPGPDMFLRLTRRIGSDDVPDPAALRPRRQACHPRVANS